MFATVRVVCCCVLCSQCRVCIVLFLLVCFCPLGSGGSSNVLGGGGVRFPGEVGVLVNPPFW